MAWLAGGIEGDGAVEVGEGLGDSAGFEMECSAGIVGGRGAGVSSDGIVGGAELVGRGGSGATAGDADGDDRNRE